MLRLLKDHFRARAIRRAQAEREVALKCFRDALSRGDTRREHEAARPAIHATCDELAACIGRAPSSWRGFR